MYIPLFCENNNENDIDELIKNNRFDGLINLIKALRLCDERWLNIEEISKKKITFE